MKPTLEAGLSATRRLTVDRDRTIAFLGDEARLYATPSLVRDIEETCRDLLLDHVDPGEDSVGTRVEIDHVAATLEGMPVEIAVSVAAVEGRLVTFEVTARDALEEIARGRHTRFVGSVARTRDAIAAKAAKARSAVPA